MRRNSPSAKSVPMRRIATGRRALRRDGDPWEIADPWAAVPVKAPPALPPTQNAHIRGRTVFRGERASSSHEQPDRGPREDSGARQQRNVSAPVGKARPRASRRVKWGGQWGTLHYNGWAIITIDELTPRMKLRSAFMKILHLLRLRRMWSQIGAMLQLAGRRTYFLRARELVWTIVSTISFGCIRRRSYQTGGTPWTLQQAWVYLGPIVRRAAPMFKHLVSKQGHQRYRSIVRERNFRSEVLRQIHNNSWWSWTPEAHRSIYHLSQEVPR